MFNFELAHWHWGSNSTQGSEHTYDGKRFPMEMHMVHYNDKYPNITEAMKQNNGLLVISLVSEV